MSSNAQPPDLTTAADVLRIELERHIQKGVDEPLLGLALSGGGIRSATFGLGVLQALTALRLFERIDYVSTVSGGGYLGGWLQANLARGRAAAALSTHGTEPREVRFLRAFSNYLTPKLGLFSGDTWAAVGVSLRNLLLNFTILSLSLIPPLFLPWLIGVLFWRTVAWNLASGLAGGLVLTIAIGLTLAVPAYAGALNMARPAGASGWTRRGRPYAESSPIYVIAILPSLVGVWLASAAVWPLAVRLLPPDADLQFIIAGATAYASAWLVGLIVGYARRDDDPRDATQTSPAPVSGPLSGAVLRRACGAGLVLVWTAFLAGLVGSATLVYGGRALMDVAGHGEQAWRAALLLFPLSVISLFIGVTAHVGLAGGRMSEETREWWGRVGGVQLLIALISTVVGTIALAGPHLFDAVARYWPWFREHQEAVGWVLGATWAGLTGAGVAAGRSERTATGAGSPVLEVIGKVAPVVFVIGYLLLLAALIHAVAPIRSLDFPLERLEDEIGAYASALLQGVDVSSITGISVWDALGLGALCIGTGALAFFVSWIVDLNEFSLHMLYRNRLVRCFLGASRDRVPDPFTGFDSEDDTPLAAHIGDDTPRRIRPYPIFNVALNLVGGRNLAWQQRKAASFVFTPEFCGFEYRNDEERDTGGRPFSAYAPTHAHAGDSTSLTIGLAVATSGAAASPNMGYHSSPTLSFLMTVFNVRLGWWLRNPLWPDVWRSRNSGVSLRELLYELLGMTSDLKKWVYLSDGGHFENLGIYELVRRRCRFIIVCDAGQDGAVTFEDLGNAIEKCRADFGIDIEIDLSTIKPSPGSKTSDWHCAIGTIRYDRQRTSDVAGTMLYLKSSLTGDEPADVLRYAAAHPAFPHESTSDQFFDESQFESYRALGFHVMHGAISAAIEASDCCDIEDVELFTRLRQQWAKPAPAPPDAVRRYSSALARVWTMLRSAPELRFLDEQMFPEMPSLMANPAPGGPTHASRRQPNYWLPPTSEERRAGFYACSEMLKLMEDAFLEFDLDQYYDHIDNRGWMNLFQHWAWSGMLCATWAIIASTFDPRFQRFCRARLDLRPGAPRVALQHAVTLPTGEIWRGLPDEGRSGVTAEWQDMAGLNFWETELVEKFLLASTSATPLRLVPVIVTVESPRRSDGNPLQFNVGYLLGDFDVAADRTPQFELHYIRIQNHLRKMGLAREALKALQKESGVRIVSTATPFDERVADGKASDEALPLPSAMQALQRLTRSLPETDAVA